MRSWFHKIPNNPAYCVPFFVGKFQRSIRQDLETCPGFLSLAGQVIGTQWVEMSGDVWKQDTYGNSKKSKNSRVLRICGHCFNQLAFCFQVYSVPYIVVVYNIGLQDAKVSGAELVWVRWSWPYEGFCCMLTQCQTIARCDYGIHLHFFWLVGKIHT